MSINESTKLNNEIFNNIEITSQESMIIKSLEKFYEEEENIKLFIPIVNSESKISIRLIDYFITKYSKNNKINYKIKDINNVEHVFNIYTSYKQQLKAFQKKHFDPFSRGDRIPYFMDNNYIITTIGQLNFFRWFISEKIYNYIVENQNIIEHDMNKKKKIECNIKKIPNKKYTNYITNNIQYKSNRILPSQPLETKIDKIVVSFTF
jgi:hypothetical protein